MLRSAQDVAAGEWHFAVAALREEVSAQQRGRGGLHEEAALPTVRHVRRVMPVHAVAAEIERLAVGERAGGAQRHVVDRQHLRDGAGEW
jgi:hypothetical protein